MSMAGLRRRADARVVLVLPAQTKNFLEHFDVEALSQLKSRCPSLKLPAR
jgi:hypothetical protein